MAEGKGGTPDRFIGLTIIGVIILLILYFFWTQYDKEIMSLIRWIRVGELYLISLFTPENYTVPVVSGGQVQNLHPDDHIKSISGLTTNQLDLGKISVINQLAMLPLKWPVIVIIGIMALIALFRGPKTVYRRWLDLNKLIKVQSKIFPIVSPFIKFDPGKMPTRPPGSPVPAELPLFSEALGPEEWLAFHAIPMPDGKLDRHAVAKAFIEQLGNPYKGWKNLSSHRQILLAAFCLRAARKRTECDDILARAAQCWDHEGGLKLGRDKKLLSEARRVLRNPELCTKVFENVKQHAYETTALIRALRTARDEGGVLAPAQFVWLRGHDRPLWYALNNLGRQAFHMEAAGAMAHFKREFVSQRPIYRPTVDDAVDGIITYMDSDLARPVPQLDYTGVKNKRGQQRSETEKSAGIKKPKMA